MFETEIIGRETVQRIHQIKNWIHIMELNGVKTPGVYEPQGKFDIMDFPKDMSRLQVLDVGCADGWYSFECERRGAEVVAIDRSVRGFALAKEILSSNVEHRVGDFMEIKEERTFDIIIFLGILYHLRHPLLALEKIRKLCRGVVYVESEISVTQNKMGEPWMKFYSGAELLADGSNWWVPNIECLQAMIKVSGFDPEVCWIQNNRACVKAFVR